MRPFKLHTRFIGDEAANVRGRVEFFRQRAVRHIEDCACARDLKSHGCIGECYRLGEWWSDWGMGKCRG